MESLLARLPSRARIAVIRLRSLGDCVLTTPALGLLKAHRPDLRVRMVVEPRFAGVFEGHPDIEEIAPRGGPARGYGAEPPRRLAQHVDDAGLGREVRRGVRASSL